jgi:hypothetical protein
MHLCYFGTSDPKSWGVSGQELISVPGITHSNVVLPFSPEREILAVTAGCRQYMHVGYKDGRVVRAWQWLDARQPVAVIANTIFIYDIKEDIAAHGRIGQLHAAQKSFPQAFRQANRILEIDPDNKKGKAFLFFLRDKIGSP